MKRDRALYFRWHHIMERCYDPNRKDYEYYGRKGIGVDAEWHQFRAFREWFKTELENTALHLFMERSKIVVDRIDPEGNYGPGNCRLITNSENSARVVHERDARGRYIKNGGRHGQD